MNYPLSSKKILLVFLGIALALTFGRLINSRFDPSYFIVAGSDFVDANNTATPVIVQKEQGYDGQFFYRYALNPFDFGNTGYGVHVDHPAYRMQRIGYPFLAWLLSLGGIPALVPLAMLLVNLLAFMGISFYVNKFIKLVGGNVAQGMYPLLLFGIYMSLSRDLAEVTELFFFTGAIYYLFRQRDLLFCIFATFTIFCRETSMISFLPLSACLVFRTLKNEGKPARIICYGIPFILFFTWKTVIFRNIPSLADAAAGYVSFGIPFKGIVMGFKQNFNLSDTKNVFQFFFWIAYLCWQLAFTMTMLRKVRFQNLQKMDNLSLLKIIYLTWLVFAVCFSDNIYGDDWGFVRVFSLWNMVGFLILIASKKQTGRLFNGCSAILLLLTIARLIIRV